MIYLSYMYNATSIIIVSYKNHCYKFLIKISYSFGLFCNQMYSCGILGMNINNFWNKYACWIVFLVAMSSFNKWRPPSLSELTPMIFNVVLTHYGSEASKYACMSLEYKEFLSNHFRYLYKKHRKLLKFCSNITFTIHFLNESQL